MRLGDRRLEDFRLRTKARAVMGCRTDVDRAECMALDTLLFSALRCYEKLGYVEKCLDRVAGQLKQHLGFRIIR